MSLNNCKSSKSIRTIDIILLKMRQIISARHFLKGNEKQILHQKIHSLSFYIFSLLTHGVLTQH